MQTINVPPDKERIPVFEQSPVLVLILGFITCGLYYFYWNYKITQVINAVLEREAVSVAAAVIGPCCLPANVYFFYEAGRCLEGLGHKTQMAGFKDEGMMLAIIAFFIPMVSAMILQSQINRLYAGNTVL
jgi:hypothetical protein